MFRVLAVTAALALGAAHPRAHAPAHAQDEEAQKPFTENVADAAAKSAVDKFKADMKQEGESLRAMAVRTVGRVAHPSVVDALFEVATRSGDKAETVKVRTEAFKALQRQKPSAKTLGPRMTKYLVEAAEENRKRKAKGDYGVLVDPKTGKTDYTSPEGKAALETKRLRGAMTAEALKILDTLEHRDDDAVDALREFLLDGNDELVACALTLLAKWKVWAALPDMQDLYEMYPSEDQHNTGSTAVDTGAAGSGDAQAAKRAWMSKYGDPDRRRARPVLVRALRAALTEITGEKFETLDALNDFLKRPDVKKKVKAK
ncbi:MAG: hypothetical protein HMLKMBBP_03113 [Planctomycetes bacterium]|nr:hypothetical protein [Planctomycetota bacterium]